MVDRILQPLEQRLVRVCFTFLGALQKIAYIRVQMAKQFIAFIVHRLSTLKLVMELFKKLAKILVSHGKLLLYCVYSHCQSNSFYNVFGCSAGLPRNWYRIMSNLALNVFHTANCLRILIESTVSRK